MSNHCKSCRCTRRAPHEALVAVKPGRQGVAGHAGEFGLAGLAPVWWVLGERRSTKAGAAADAAFGVPAAVPRTAPRPARYGDASAWH
mmetsp:Transcript_57829/g.96313  ORF Transcript_57829/g.96313 Transcript_57829/m.96313 type:complete len:88 (+) Transcript_57829:12-275(+)